MIPTVNRGHSGNNRTKTNLPGLLRPVRQVLAVGLLVRSAAHLPAPVVALSACTHDRRRFCGFAWASPEVGISHRRLPAAITVLKAVSDKVMYLVRDAAALYLVTRGIPSSGPARRCRASVATRWMEEARDEWVS